MENSWSPVKYSSRESNRDRQYSEIRDSISAKEGLLLSNEAMV